MLRGRCILLCLGEMFYYHLFCPYGLYHQLAPAFLCGYWGTSLENLNIELYKKETIVTVILE